MKVFRYVRFIHFKKVIVGQGEGISSLKDSQRFMEMLFSENKKMFGKFSKPSTHSVGIIDF